MLMHRTIAQAAMVVEHITPTMARSYLERGRRNRPVSVGHVRSLAAAMSGNRWRVNAQTIKFDQDGNLLDGQHRLQACVLAETPFDSWVARNIDGDTFDTIDTGKKRLSADILAIEGCKWATATAGAARMVLAIQAGHVSDTNMKASPDEIRLFYAAYPDIERSAVATANCKHLLAPSVAGALHFVFSQVSAEDTAKFFEDLAFGVGLAGDDGVLVLREKLMCDRLRKAKLPRMEIAACVIRAWNARRENRPIKLIKGMIKTADGLTFPAIV